MKKLCLLLSLCMAMTVQAEEGLVDKAERGIKKAGEATNEGIDKGAAAANKGVNKAFDTVNEKVFKPADSWIQEKVGKPKTGGESKPAQNSP